MKRCWFPVASLISLCLCWLLFAGCQAGIPSQKQLAAEDLVFSLQGEVEIKVGDAVYTCAVQYDRSQLASLTLQTPEQVKGLTYFWQGDRFQITYEGLSVESKDCPLGDCAFAAVLVRTLNAAQNTQSLTPMGGNAFQGNDAGVLFTLTAEPGSGKIITIEVPHYDFLASFTYPEIPSYASFEEVYAEHP